MSHKRHINEFLHTDFANSGRAAGAGILYDRYDEESGYRPGPKARGPIRFPSDSLTAEERLALNGEVRIIQKGRAKHEPAQRWIPVSERLPDYGVEVLVAVIQADGGRTIDIDYMDEVNAFAGSCSHWMPLPEPPKGE